MALFQRITAAPAIECAFCHAKPGEPCRARKTGTVQHTHLERLRAARAAEELANGK